MKTWSEFCAEPQRFKVMAPGENSGAREVFRFINRKDYETIQNEAAVSAILELAKVFHEIHRLEMFSDAVNKMSGQLDEALRQYAEDTLNEALKPKPMVKATGADRRNT